MNTGLDLATVQAFGVALLLGALIGLEREQRKTQDAHVGVAGIRTFILFAEAGALAAWLSRQFGSPWFFAAGAITVTAIIVAGYRAQTSTQPGSLGLTTEMAGLATFLLGATVAFGFTELAVALGIVTSAVLAYRQPLHALVARVGTDDLYAGVKLLIATFIVLPLLPNRPVDPWGVLNPYSLWLLVILISGLSVVGYVAMRILGQARGTTLTGLFGGLVSSTAVTLAFARRSGDASELREATSHTLAAGILLSWTVMFVRVIVEVAVVFAPLLPALTMALGAMSAVALAVAAWHYRHGSRAESLAASAARLPLRNPFSFAAAVPFSALFAAVLLVVEFTRRYVPEGGLYVVAAVAGLTDVDAITLSMATLAREGGDPSAAVGGIVTATLTNTVVKAGLVAGLASAALRRHVLLATLAILCTGAGVLLLR